MKFYDDKGCTYWMERIGKFFSFLGAVAVLYGTTEELEPNLKPYALVAVSAAASLMAVLLFVPFLAWLLSHLKGFISWLRGKVQQPETEATPGDEDGDQEDAITDSGGADKKIKDVTEPEKGADETKQRDNRVLH